MIVNQEKIFSSDFKIENILLRFVRFLRYKNNFVKEKYNNKIKDLQIRKIFH